uniref:winged helix-turn-helix domain-containing protein n=1 Tax=Streptomyces europaeiscabiei TaxID=146819 RepID=UPI0038D3C792
MQAAELFAQQVKPPEVARQLRVSLKSAYRWQQLWRQGGADELLSRGPSGGRCRLSPRCLEKLARYLEQGPAAHGWTEDQVWTAARVATLIGRKFHVSYSVSGATRLMHRLGFSPQVPARRVAERDEESVKVWKEATWAEVKGPGRPVGGGGGAISASSCAVRRCVSGEGERPSPPTRRSGEVELRAA